jgi:histidinol dehydrogenase
VGSIPTGPTVTITIRKYKMSKETKKDIEFVKKLHETVKEGTAPLIERTEKFDKELSTKIRKVQESSEEVIKHIEKKTSEG